MMSLLLGGLVLLGVSVFLALIKRWISWMDRLKPGDRVRWKQEGLNGYGQPRTGQGYGTVLEHDRNGHHSNWGYIVKLDAPGGYKGTEEEIWARREELSKM